MQTLLVPQQYVICIIDEIIEPCVTNLILVVSLTKTMENVQTHTVRIYVTYSR